MTIIGESQANTIINGQQSGQKPNKIIIVKIHYLFKAAVIQCAPPYPPVIFIRFNG
jgi:hypothetical protein